MRWDKRLASWFLPEKIIRDKPPRPSRGRVDHVICLDGTLADLTPGHESNVGLIYRLLGRSGARANMALHYEAGIQWMSWRNTLDVIEGRGINRQIRDVYGVLASHYRPGDRIYLFGYSRGAFAVRSLAGFIDRIGLLELNHATQRNIREAYRHYETDPNSDAAQAFKRHYCYAPGQVEIEMIGVFDTVKALGIDLPILSRLSSIKRDFHDSHLGNSVKRGYHALALHETRRAFQPVLWTDNPNWQGDMVQMWFRGTHADIGGQLSGHDETRPLSNIPLVWILEQAEAAGLTLPEGWRDGFPQDGRAPSIGTLRGWGKIFMARKRRRPGITGAQTLHMTAHKGRGFRRPKRGAGGVSQPFDAAGK